MTTTISVESAVTAALLVGAGDGQTLLVNMGPDDLFIGDTNSIAPTDSTGIVPIIPNSYFAVDGENNLYGVVSTGNTANVQVISGGLNFFSPASGPFEGGDVILSDAGLFIYSGQPAFGNLIESHVDGGTGIDQFGNNYFSGDSHYNNSFGPSHGTGYTINGGLEFITGGLGVGWTIDAGWEFNGSAWETNQPIVSALGTPANPTLIVTDSWQTMTPFINGWASAAGFKAARFQLKPDNEVEVQGVISAAAATSGGFFQTTGVYVPTTGATQVVCSAGETALLPNAISPWVSINSTGVLSVQDTDSVPNAFSVAFHGTYSLM